MTRKLTKGGSAALILVLVLAMGCTSVHAMRLMFPWSACEEARVTITLETPAASVRKRLSSSQLSEIGTAMGSGHSGGTTKTMGLYQARIKMDMKSMTINAMGLGSARMCVVQTDVKVDLIHAIDLARELDGQDCEFNEALKHERMHEQIQVQTMRESQSYIEEVVKLRLREFKAADLNGVKTALDQMQNALLKEMGVTLSERAQKRQTLLDTQEEYKRVTNACPAR